MTAARAYDIALMPDAELAEATAPGRGRRATLWGGTALVVLAAHLAFFIAWHPLVKPAGRTEAPPVVMIDLAPLPAPPAPAAPPSPAVPTKAPPVAHPQPASKPVMQPPPKPVETPPQPVAPPPPAPTPAVTPLTPTPTLDLPPTPAEAELPIPPPPPPAPPRPVHQPVVHRPPPRVKTPVTTRAESVEKPVTAPAPMPSATTATTTAPARPSTSGGAAQQNWESRLLAHIAQYKSYPAIAQENDWQGMSVVRFTFRRDGTVIAAEIVHGSGHAALDQAALATLHRASPLPPPPASVPGDPITLTLPLQFSLQQD